jgi:DNA-binding GntR family transcriptional regulator
MEATLGGTVEATARGSLADRAYAAIRDQLVSLRLPPGSAMDEEAIAAELGMGRTPVREAIKRLALEDLVEIYPRRGTFAAEIHITDLAAIFEVRLPLEGDAAFLAAQRRSAAQALEVQALLDDVRRLAATPDAGELMALDGRVHRLVYACADNRFLEATLTRYLNLSLRIWHLALPRVPNLLDRMHEHADLLLAVRDRKPDEARAIVREHVSTFEREIRAVL